MKKLEATIARKEEELKEQDAVIQEQEELMSSEIKKLGEKKDSEINALKAQLAAVRCAHSWLESVRVLTLVIIFAGFWRR